MKFTTKNGLDGGTPFMTKLMLVGVFLIMTVSCGYAMSETLEFADKLQRYAYSIGFSALLSGLVVALLYTMQPKVRYRTPKHSAWFYPLLAGGLALVAMSLSYIWMGVWPFGIESVMIVDMHHQYGPLLAYLRDVVRNGGNLLYTFETGVGANFISMFAYYLASPFNLLLALPDRGHLAHHPAQKRAVRRLLCGVRAVRVPSPRSVGGNALAGLFAVYVYDCLLLEHYVAGRRDGVASRSARF